MKNQAKFTPHQAETWAAALSCFDAKAVCRAIIEQGLNTDPFPDLSKIILRAETIRREKAGTIPQGGVVTVGPKVVDQVAEAFGIEI